MRVLLTSNASHLPPRGGSTRSNLAWMRHLAAQGHICRAVAASLDEDREGVDGGITIRSVRDLARRVHILAEEIRSFHPDWVLVSSEDLSHSLLREAATVAPGRIVYLAHTPQFCPFGPESWNADARAAALVKESRAVVAIGEHMAAYIRRYLGRDARVIHPPIYGRPPYRICGAFENPWVLMINPCVVKGLPILLDLASRMPELEFATLRGWGTTSRDLAAMAKHPNVRLLENVPDIEDVLSQSRLLLMPSLWYEGFGLIAMEAMLRGLPVIASDSGGLEEAKRGTGYVIPVRAIQRYEASFDEAHMPRPVVEPQDLLPWQRALTALTSDQGAWAAEAERSRRAGLDFVSKLDAAQFEEFLSSLAPHRTAVGVESRPMRILLAHNSLYYPSHGGGDRSNRLLMEALAARGHEVRVVARIERFDEPSHARYLEELAARGVEFKAEDGVVRLQLNEVDVRTLTLNPRLRTYFAEQIVEFDPDIIIASTDDPAHLLLDAALRAERARVVYLVRATIAVPFGPDASSPHAGRAEALRHVDGIVGVSEYVARYVREYGRTEAIHVPISLMEPGVPEALGYFDSPYITMANPCAVKGIDVFLGIAERLPQLSFAAVPTWGTTARDLERLSRLPNVTILPAADRIDDLLRQTRILLVPSVWAEARSRIVQEAMMRGVPVLASDQGGLPEAKLGVPYTLPVTPLTGYRPSVDENMVPVAEVPPQDVTSWVDALRRLTSDPQHWTEIARESRRAALDYLERLNVQPFERYLRQVLNQPRRSTVPADVPLSDERRRLVALRVRQKLQQAPQRDPWFPTLASTAPSNRTLRLFCFPFAGGGTLPYSLWSERLAKVATVVPVLLPGRETRAGESLFTEMGTLIAELLPRFLRWVDGEVPFAFFGHSLGAGIAFELARALRRAKRPLPELLILSAARAPQCRARRAGEPVDDREIATPEQLANSEWRRLALPALRADTQLYRDHVFAAESPLAIPISAWGGVDDPNVRPEHLDGWREHTSRSFHRRDFPGGHLYIQLHPEQKIEALKRELQDLG